MTDRNYSVMKMTNVNLGKVIKAFNSLMGDF